MVDELHCEMQDVVAKAEVKELFDYVVENNIQYYRAVTSAKSGKKRYYFDEEKGCPQVGVNTEWFANPHYQEKVVVEQETVEIENDIEDEVEVDVEDLIKQRDELENELDELQEKYDNLMARYDDLDKKYLKAQQDFAVLNEEVKTVKRFFKGV